MVRRWDVFWLLSFYFTLISLKLSTTCLIGCHCSNQNDVALCCLPPADSVQQSVVNTSTDYCFTGLRPSHEGWPRIGSCLPSWRQLQVRLGPSSWSSLRTSTSASASSCGEHLEKLVLSGSDNVDDGLLVLDPVVLRRLLFQDSGVLQLRHLVIQQTQLHEIIAGFIDQLKAFRLTDLEVTRNPHLTSDGLGVGWLVGAPHLRLLSLSRNQLTAVNLAKWGFASNTPTGLLTLDLSGNQLAFLKPRTFVRVPNLLKLDLSGNSLTSLPLDVFHGLDNLKILNLQKNHLTVSGLQLSAANLAMVLPNLNQLQLSANPLLLYNTSYTQWWLSSQCPPRLYQVALEHLTSHYPAKPNVALNLPPISWDRCPSITHIFLGGMKDLHCIPQRWLQLPPYATAIPESVEVVPRSLKLCAPLFLQAFVTPRIHTTPPSIALASFDGVRTDPVTFIPRTDPTPTSESRSGGKHVLGVLRLHTSGFEPWLLVLLLALLFLLVIVVLIWGIVYWARQYCKRRTRGPKMFMLAEQQLNTPMVNGLSASYHVGGSSLCRRGSVLSSRAAYSPLTCAFIEDTPEYLRSPYASNQPCMRICTQSDSGVGDVTPGTKRTCVPAPQKFSPDHSRIYFRQNVTHRTPSVTSVLSFRGQPEISPETSKSCCLCRTGCLPADAAYEDVFTQRTLINEPDSHPT